MSPKFIDLTSNVNLIQKFGIDDGWRFGMLRNARFADLDALAHLNHTTYLRYFEDCRLQYLIHFGLEKLKYCDPSGASPVLLGLEIRYLLPVLHGDEVLVTTRCTKIGNTSMTLEYSAWTSGCAAWCIGTFVMIVPASGEKVAVSKEMKDAISSFETQKVLT